MSFVGQKVHQDEFNSLRSQNATLESGRRKHRKYLPFAFTEQGVAMLSSGLTSDRAVLVNVSIMRTLVKLRQALLEESLIRSHDEA